MGTLSPMSITHFVRSCLGVLARLLVAGVGAGLIGVLAAECLGGDSETKTRNTLFVGELIASLALLPVNTWLWNSGKESQDDGRDGS
jgi:hypothetical protein